MPLLALALFVAGCVTPPVETETVYLWHTLAGQPGGLGNVDGQGAEARFCQPCGVACDGAGNVYVADYYNYAIRKISRDGTVTTFAGSVGDSGNNDGIGNGARFDKPSGVAVDASGNVYVADSGNHAIRRVTPNGEVSTFAGLPGSSGYVDGKGSAARFRYPQDVAVDAAGNVYVADGYNHAIRKVKPDGTVTTLAGALPDKNGQPVAGSLDGKGAAARFRGPRGVACDAAGNLYVADTENAVVRKVSSDGTVRTLAGSAGKAGSADGLKAVARFAYPQGVAVDAAGNVYVADTWNRSVRKVAPSGAVHTLTNAVADFLSPRGLAVNAVGSLIVSDNERQTIYRLTAKGAAALLAGSASRHGSADGSGSAACFNRPCGIAVGSHGRLTVTDNFNHTVRTVTPEGVVTTLVGRALSSGSLDGTGAVARLSWPSGAAQDNKGNVYWADSGNHTIRKVSPDGVATTLAGSAGNSGSVDASGSKARFAWPADVAIDADGNLYVADRGNHTIRKVTAEGAVTTFAGAAGMAGRGDGVGGAARFNNPSGVAVDDVGNVYVADTGNHTIRKVVPGGEVTTLAGCAGIRGGVDGRGVFARFNGPADVAVDRAGNVYVADRDNHMIRRVSSAGVVTTLGGAPNAMSAADGLGGCARFAQPSGVTLGNDGCLYVADACNNRIAVGVPTVVEKRTVSAEFARRGEAGKKAAAAVIREQPYAWDVFAGQPGAHGIDDGQGRGARLGGPQGMAIDGKGILYLADGRDNAIRKIAPDGVVSTLRRKHGAFAALVGIAVDASDNCYVTDSAHGLWKVGASGEAKRVADASVKFGFASGVAVDGQGNVYVADYNACTLRKVTPAGEASLFAGCAGQDGNVDGVGGQARFARPSAVAMGCDGVLFVAAGNKIRKVTGQGEVTTLAASATFGRLDGLAVDGDGNVYAADRELHAIWKVSRKGEIAKLGGSEQAMGGSGWMMTGLAVDRAGNVYVSDFTRNCIIKGTPQK